MTRHYEELEVGEVFESGGYTVTKEEIITFAEQFDPQPFHIDEDAAQDSLFGGLVASGLHTLCLSVRLFIVEVVQGEDAVANMGSEWTTCDGTSRCVPVIRSASGSRWSRKRPRRADRIGATLTSVAVSSLMRTRK